MPYFHPHAPEIRYVYNDENTFVFSSMASALFAVNEHVAEHAFLSQLSSCLSCNTVGYRNSIRFVTNIQKKCVKNKG